MRINSVSLFHGANGPDFKAAIPVVYWEKLPTGKYRLVDTLKKTEQFQNLLVRRANGTGGRNKQAEKERKLVQSYLRDNDRDYALSFNDSKFMVIRKVQNEGVEKDVKKLVWERVGSSYDANGGLTSLPARFNPFVYLLTGYDKLVINSHQQQIHKAWGLAPKAEECILNGTEIIAKNGKVKTSDVEIALNDLKNGKQKLASRPTNQELHVKIMPKGKSYIIEDLKFCDKDGKNSPYVRTKIYPAE